MKIHVCYFVDNNYVAEVYAFEDENECIDYVVNKIRLPHKYISIGFVELDVNERRD